MPLGSGMLPTNWFLAAASVAVALAAAESVLLQIVCEDAMFPWIVLAILVLLSLYGIFIYNQLVLLRHGVDQSWSNIDVLLKQRHDELPKLVEVCRQYMRFEQDTLERVTQARASVFAAEQSGDLSALGAAEGLLRMGLGQLYAVAENYPDLKADAQFQHLQQRISGLENGIADRREFYNAAVNALNVRISSFPDAIVAGLFRFGPRRLLSFPRADKADVDVRALFREG